MVATNDNPWKTSPSHLIMTMRQLRLHHRHDQHPTEEAHHECKCAHGIQFVGFASGGAGGLESRERRAQAHVSNFRGMQFVIDILFCTRISNSLECVVAVICASQSLEREIRTWQVTHGHLGRKAEHRVKGASACNIEVSFSTVWQQPSRACTANLQMTGGYLRHATLAMRVRRFVCLSRMPFPRCNARMVPSCRSCASLTKLRKASFSRRNKYLTPHVESP